MKFSMPVKSPFPLHALAMATTFPGRAAPAEAEDGQFDDAEDEMELDGGAPSAGNGHAGY